MSKLTLADLASLTNETAAINLINANSALIETAMEKTLSRDGTTPNQMGADLDMNSHHILNMNDLDMNGNKITGLADGSQSGDAISFDQLNDLAIGAGGLPLGGVLNQVLLKNSSADFDTRWGVPTYSSLSLTGTLNINPTAGSFVPGIVVQQTPSGSYSSGVSGDLTFFNGVIITNFNVRDTTAGHYSTFGGLGSQLIVNGSSAYSPNGTFGFISDIQTHTIAPSSIGTVNQFSAILGRGIVRTSVPAGVSYGMNGLNANVAIDTGVTGVAQISGVESDVTAIGSAPLSKFAYSAYLGPLDLHQGSLNDATFYFGVAPGTTLGWHNAFLLDGSQGTLFDTGACVLCTKGSLTIAKGIDLSGWTVSGNAWASPGVTISGGGDFIARDISGRNGVFQFDENSAFPLIVKNLSAGSGAIAEYILQTNTTNSLAYWQLADQSGSPDVIFETGPAVLHRFSRMNGTTIITETKAGGVQIGAPTGTDKGVGSLNAQSLYIQGTAVTLTPAIGSITGLGTGVATALAINVGSAGAFVTLNGALGSPSSAGTIPAFTLGGTIAGGGNQINNVIIGTSTPLAGTFTTATANSFIPNSSTVPSNGMYLPVANTLGWAVSSGSKLQLSTTALSPTTDGFLSFGTTSLGWLSLFASTGFAINVSNGNWVIAHTSGIMTVSTGDLRVTTAGTNSASVVTVGGTQTLTNKTLTARTIGGVSFDGTANITVATATGGFTVSGGDLALGANNLTMTGSLGATGARLTKGWFTDLQVTNAISGSVTGNAGTVTGLTLANSLIQAGNFATTITSTATSNATLPAGTRVLAAIDLQQTWTAGVLFSGSSASFSPMQFQDTNAGGHLWLNGPGTGTGSPTSFNIYDSTAAITVAKFGTDGSFTAAGPIKTGGYTVATLPTGVIGMLAYVTDADACTFLATVVHTVGTAICPVFYNGTNWVGA